MKRLFNKVHALYLRWKYRGVRLVPVPARSGEDRLFYGARFKNQSMPCDPDKRAGAVLKTE